MHMGLIRYASQTWLEGPRGGVAGGGNCSVPVVDVGFGAAGEREVLPMLLAWLASGRIEPDPCSAPCKSKGVSCDGRNGISHCRSERAHQDCRYR